MPWRRVSLCRCSILSDAAILLFHIMNPKSFSVFYLISLLIHTTNPSAFAQNPIETSSAVLTKLDEMVITASPFDLTLFQQVQPATVLKDQNLLLKMQPTLGESLNNEPGVSSTWFGPGASRPIIRGLGDDRVRILQNGISVLDVSNVSPDHAVASDPLSIRAVEVVRGPATLLYGPNTIGGVINVIDDRIPQERFDGAYPTGKFQSSVGSADDLFSQSGDITWGSGPIVFHIDGFNSATNDLDIPGFARSAAQLEADPMIPEPRDTLPNSATETKGAGLGGSYIWKGGFLGFSYSGVDSHYGTVAEPDVTIDMQQRRWDMRGAIYAPQSWIAEINYKLGYSDYEHAELEGNEVGTIFQIEGYDGRVELLHQKTDLLEGAVGFESQGSKFSALGEEAFLPAVETNVNSIFFFEEIPLDQLRLQFGARYDRQANDSEANAVFGPGLSREFNAFSTSTGIVWNPTDDYAIALSFAHTQRPPSYVELFADGPHVATGTFERGDPNLGTEDSFSVDLSLRKRTGRIAGSISGFYYHFNDFISLQPSGLLDPEDSLPIYDYRPIGAIFSGGEIETTFHLLEAARDTPEGGSASPAAIPASVERLDLILGVDYVHAEDRNTGEPIPRIAPLRTRVALDYSIGKFDARLECLFAAAQHRHAEYELPTDGYFLLNASSSYNLPIGGLATTIFLKGVNLTNEEARQSSSFLKDMAPMPGRGVVLGLRVDF